jgi:hypothetical protein
LPRRDKYADERAESTEDHQDERGHLPLERSNGATFSVVACEAILFYQGGPRLISRGEVLLPTERS